MSKSRIGFIVFFITNIAWHLTCNANPLLYNKIDSLNIDYQFIDYPFWMIRLHVKPVSTTFEVWNLIMVNSGTLSDAENIICQDLVCRCFLNDDIMNQDIEKKTSQPIISNYITETERLTIEQFSKKEKCEHTINLTLAIKNHSNYTIIEQGNLRPLAFYQFIFWVRELAKAKGAVPQ